MSVVQMVKLRICESLAQAAKLGMQPVPLISTLRVLATHLCSTNKYPSSSVPSTASCASSSDSHHTSGELPVTPKREQRSTEVRSLTQSHTIIQAGRVTDQDSLPHSEDLSDLPSLGLLASPPPGLSRAPHGWLTFRRARLSQFWMFTQSAWL